MIAIQIFGVAFLIAINAFFSAAEFALVAVRQSRIRQLVEQGNLRARIVEQLLSDLGRVVSGVQVGLTIANLALGYLGEITLSSILAPFVHRVVSRWAAAIEHIAALVIVFGLLTILQVVFGELVPKGLSLAGAERVALLVARPFRWFLNTFSWAIGFLDGFAEKVMKVLGVAAPQSHTMVRSAEELQVMIQQVRDLGLLPAAEARFIQNAMELNRIEVREVMVARPDIHALPSDASLEDAMKMFATTQRSRLPVYEGSLDHILGFVHIKDVIWLLLERASDEHGSEESFQLSAHLRPVLIVPETKASSGLLREFLSRRVSLAMVVDEFGSILGLVTLEDILEQMVGEIHDEFDVEEHPMLLDDGAMIFDAAIKVRDLESQYNITLPEDSSYETVGGFVLSRLGFIPRGGEAFESDGYRFTVMEVDQRRVSRVKVQPLRPRPAPSEIVPKAAEIQPPAQERDAREHQATVAARARSASAQSQTSSSSVSSTSSSPSPSRGPRGK